jgi:phosphohistidine phosphatase
MTARRIYLAQHGLALDKKIDPERPLSEQGIAQTRTVAEQLQQANINVTRIFHSGKLRARQTAEIFASVLAVDVLASTAGFSPNDDVKQTVSRLTFDDALYIGHLPHLDKLVSLLVSGDEASDVLMFQNSAVVCLEKDTSKDNYSIRWYLSDNLVSN